MKNILDDTATEENLRQILLNTPFTKKLEARWGGFLRKEWSGKWKDKMGTSEIPQNFTSELVPGVNSVYYFCIIDGIKQPLLSVNFEIHGTTCTVKSINVRVNFHRLWLGTIFYDSFEEVLRENGVLFLAWSMSEPGWELAKKRWMIALLPESISKDSVRERIANILGPISKKSNVYFLPLTPSSTASIKKILNEK